MSDQPAWHFPYLLVFKFKNTELANYMAVLSQPEFWLRGPVDGVPLLLQPVAHALLQANAEVQELMTDFPESRLWYKPAGAASAGFHLQHLPGVIDRLFTYARGEQLTREQLDYLAAEGKINPASSVASLLTAFSSQVDTAIHQLRHTTENSLLNPIGVGRKLIPSNVLGLLFHAAEHTQRHTGQLLVTVKVALPSQNQP
jgi:uncharacterized damage-inducible protein DinB